ncbi:MAG TPA: hypothetical protein EYP69_02765, partial [Bacteroidales bacterium]|nr:hypothetical protein [Bacteroidales bacterium]
MVDRIKTLSILLLMLTLFLAAKSEQKIPAYYKTGIIAGNLTEIKTKVKTVLSEKQFKLIGSYHPEGKSGLYVMVFTRKD